MPARHSDPLLVSTVIVPPWLKCSPQRCRSTAPAASRLWTALRSAEPGPGSPPEREVDPYRPNSPLGLNLQKAARSRQQPFLAVGPSEKQRQQRSLRLAKQRRAHSIHRTGCTHLGCVCTQFGFSFQACRQRRLRQACVNRAALALLIRAPPLARSSRRHRRSVAPAPASGRLHS